MRLRGCRISGKTYEAAAPRTVSLDLTALRNVLKAAVKAGHMRGVAALSEDQDTGAHPAAAAHAWRVRSPAGLLSFAQAHWRAADQKMASNCATSCGCWLYGGARAGAFAPALVARRFQSPSRVHRRRRRLHRHGHDHRHGRHFEESRLALDGFQRATGKPAPRDARPPRTRFLVALSFAPAGRKGHSGENPARIFRVGSRCRETATCRFPSLADAIIDIVPRRLAVLHEREAAEFIDIEKISHHVGEARADLRVFCLLISGSHIVEHLCE